MKSISFGHDNDGFTTVIWPRDKGHPEIVPEKVKQPRINFNQADNDRKSALDWLPCIGDSDIDPDFDIF